jgi:hypothetical protein
LHMWKECVVTCFSSLNTSPDSQLPLLPHNRVSGDSGPAQCGAVLPNGCDLICI